MPLMIFAAAQQNKAFVGYSADAAKGLEEAGHLAVEALTGVRTVAAFGLQARVMAAFSASLAGPRRAGIKRGWVGGAGLGFSASMQFVSYAIAFCASPRRTRPPAPAAAPLTAPTPLRAPPLQTRAASSSHRATSRLATS